jgi:hypothetical protein
MAVTKSNYLGCMKKYWAFTAMTLAVATHSHGSGGLNMEAKTITCRISYGDSGPPAH